MVADRCAASDGVSVGCYSVSTTGGVSLVASPATRYPEIWKQCRILRHLMSWLGKRPSLTDIETEITSSVQRTAANLLPKVDLGETVGGLVANGLGNARFQHCSNGAARAMMHPIAELEVAH